MKREEKRKRFHDALLHMLYPPPPSPPHSPHNDTLTTSTEDLNVDSIPDGGLGEDESTSSSSDNEEDGESGSRKLTRAQRKRIRKKKLKEAASRHRKIVGPLLPTAVHDGEAGEEVEDCSLQVARENATKKADTAAFTSKQSKLRCRRLAKKLGGQSSKSTTKENEGQG